MPQAELKIIVTPNADLEHKAVCLFVSYSPTGRVKNYVRLHLDRLRSSGVSIFFIMVAERPRLLNLRERVGPVAGLVVRENRGFDFGAWADVLRAFPSLWRVDTLLLVNDSVFGPFGDYEKVFHRVLNSDADLIGLTESVQGRRHFQSYFLAFRRPARHATELKSMWDQVTDLPTKMHVVGRYELNLLERSLTAGLTAEAIFPAAIDEHTDPMQHGWTDLVKRGCPYAKVSLLKDNPFNVVFTVDPRSLVNDPAVVRAIDDYVFRNK